MQLLLFLLLGVFVFWLLLRDDCSTHRDEGFGGGHGGGGHGGHHGGGGHHHGGEGGGWWGGGYGGWASPWRYPYTSYVVDMTPTYVDTSSKKLVGQLVSASAIQLPIFREGAVYMYGDNNTYYPIPSDVKMVTGETVSNLPSRSGTFKIMMYQENLVY